MKSSWNTILETTVLRHRFLLRRVCIWIHSYAVYKVVPLGENKSRLEISMNFRTKPAFMGSIAKGKFMATIEDYALAIEHHVKTGEKLSKDNFKGFKSQYGI